jgi:hypothetical protein
LLIKDPNIQWKVLRRAVDKAFVRGASKADPQPVGFSPAEIIYQPWLYKALDEVTRFLTDEAEVHSITPPKRTD